MHNKEIRHRQKNEFIKRNRIRIRSKQTPALFDSYSAIFLCLFYIYYRILCDEKEIHTKVIISIVVSNRERCWLTEQLQIERPSMISGGGEREWVGGRVGWLKSDAEGPEQASDNRPCNTIK